MGAIEVRARSAWTFTIRDGAIERVCMHQECPEALKAAGLRECQTLLLCARSGSPSGIAPSTVSALDERATQTKSALWDFSPPEGISSFEGGSSLGSDRLQAPGPARLARGQDRPFV
jgi:hypothetical protein